MSDLLQKLSTGLVTINHYSNPIGAAVNVYTNRSNAPERIINGLVKDGFGDVDSLSKEHDRFVTYRSKELAAENQRPGSFLQGVAQGFKPSFLESSFGIASSPEGYISKDFNSIKRNGGSFKEFLDVKEHAGENVAPRPEDQIHLKDYVKARQEAHKNGLEIEKLFEKKDKRQHDHDKAYNKTHVLASEIKDELARNGVVGSGGQIPDHELVNNTPKISNPVVQTRARS